LIDDRLLAEDHPLDALARLAQAFAESLDIAGEHFGGDVPRGGRYIAIVHAFLRSVDDGSIDG